MNPDISLLISKFADETGIDDVEIEQSGKKFLVNTDEEQIGEIIFEEEKFYISLLDGFKGKKFGSGGWVF